MIFDETLYEGIPVIRLRGRLDSRSAQACAERLTPLVHDGRRALILDVADLDHVGGAGLRVLLMLAMRARTYGGLRLCGSTLALIRALEISGLAGQLELYPDLAAGAAR